MKSLPVCRTIQINGKPHSLWRAVDQESLPHEALWVWRGGSLLLMRLYPICSTWVVIWSGLNTTEI